MAETQLAKRLDRETFMKGTNLIKNFNPGTIFANETLDAWFIALKHLEPEVYIKAVNQICTSVKWFYSTNFARVILEAVPDVLSRKSEQQSSSPQPVAEVQRERNVKFMRYIRRCLDNKCPADEQLVREVAAGRKDISAFTGELLPQAEGYPNSWNEV